MTYNEYKIQYKILGIKLYEKEQMVLGVKELMKEVSLIRKNMCVGLQIYLVKLRNKPIREKPVYTHLWV